MKAQLFKVAKMGKVAPYATSIPIYIEVWKTTIEKHYHPTMEECQEGSIRVVKPQKNVLVYLCCKKGDKWNPKTQTCTPNPSVHKSIVPKTKKYLDEVEHLKLIHPEIKVVYRGKEIGVEPKAGALAAPGAYLISPVAYVDGDEERAWEPMQFKSLDEAEEFIADMGSMWVLYPNIEIYKNPSIIKRLFRRKELEFVKGYDERGEYDSVEEGKTRAWDIGAMKTSGDEELKEVIKAIGKAEEI